MKKLIVACFVLLLLLPSFAVAQGVLTPAANPPGGVISGSVDNAVLRADGTGGMTSQAGTPDILDDTGAHTMQPSGAVLTGAGQYFYRYNPSLGETFTTPPLKYNFSLSSYANVNDACMGGNAPDNHVTAEGWNYSPTGRENAAFSAMAIKAEHGYCIGGVMGHEWHLEQIDSAGVIHRPISLWTPWDGVSGAATQSLTFDLNRVDIRRYNTTANGTIQQQILKINAEQSQWSTDWYGRTTTETQLIRSNANGCPWIQQRNRADSAYIDYPCFRGVGASNTDEFFWGGNTGLWWQATRGGGTATFPSSAYVFGIYGSPVSGDTGLHLTGNSITGNFLPIQSVFATTGNQTIGNYNNNNATASNALFEVRTIGDAAGDPAIVFNINGIQTASLGLDNSVAGNPLVLSANSAVGTNPLLIFDTTGTDLGEMTLASVLFANLGTPAVGTTVYCSDCVKVYAAANQAAAVCAGAGTGAFARRINGGGAVWICD